MVQMGIQLPVARERPRVCQLARFRVKDNRLTYCEKPTESSVSTKSPQRARVGARSYPASSLGALASWRRSEGWAAPYFRTVPRHWRRLPVPDQSTDLELSRKNRCESLRKSWASTKLAQLCAGAARDREVPPALPSNLV